MTMNANDHRITWCLNWGEDIISGWSACYCVSPDQERGRRELCAYIDSEGYAPEIKDYINSVEW